MMLFTIMPIDIRTTCSLKNITADSPVFVTTAILAFHPYPPVSLAISLLLAIYMSLVSHVELVSDTWFSISTMCTEPWFRCLNQLNLVGVPICV